MRNLIVSNFVRCICNCKILKQLLDSTGVVAYKADSPQDANDALRS